MRVFTPAEARVASEERTAKDVIRAQILAETTQDLIKTRTDAERAFDATMKEKQQIAEEWFASTVERKQELVREVEELERRRKIALSPPLIKASNIHSVQEALHARTLELDFRELTVEEESRLLMRKLDDVSAREQDVKTREARLKRKELGAEAQRNQIAADAKRLNLQLADFQKRTEDRETDFAYRQSELDARENLCSEKEHGFVLREQELEAARRLLADQRLLLDKGFEELKRLKQKHGSRN